MIIPPVIKVFYDGLGVARDAKHGVKNIQKQSVCHVGQKFYLSDFDSKRFEQIENAEINRFVFLSNKWGNDVTHLDSSTFVPTDKDGNPDPFEIVKGQDIYRHQNGNALRLFFDDAPLDDVAPTEKELSEPKEKTSIYQLRDDDFLAWIVSEHPDFERMTKKQIHKQLKLRNPDLWSYIGDDGFNSWWERQPHYKAKRGRKKCTPKN